MTSRWNQESSYVYRLNAVMLPDGTPLMCAGEGKIVYPSHEAAERAASALERIDKTRMRTYRCPQPGPLHFHIARYRTSAIRRENAIRREEWAS